MRSKDQLSFCFFLHNPQALSQKIFIYPRVKFIHYKAVRFPVITGNQVATYRNQFLNSRRFIQKRNLRLPPHRNYFKLNAILSILHKLIKRIINFQLNLWYQGFHNNIDLLYRIRHIRKILFCNHINVRKAEHNPPNPLFF